MRDQLSVEFDVVLVQGDSKRGNVQRHVQDTEEDKGELGLRDRRDMDGSARQGDGDYLSDEIDAHREASPEGVPIRLLEVEQRVERPPRLGGLSDVEHPPGRTERREVDADDGDQDVEEDGDNLKLRRRMTSGTCTSGMEG